MLVGALGLLVSVSALPAQSRGTTARRAAAADASCAGTVYGQGRRAICLPFGAASFADSVVSFAPGARPSEDVWAQPQYVLGEPDYTRTTAPGFLSLGCDGVLVVRFDDNALVDVDGPDLYVFEIGPAVEATELAVSVDGRTWLEVGRIEGARAELDLTGTIDPADVYRYVRLTNRSRTCGGRHSGADIDAIAAVGSALRVALDAAVLFDVGQSTLKPEAEAAITRAAAVIRERRATQVLVEGHTDSDGDAAANEALSTARAEAVRDALVGAGVDAGILRTRGLGERRPVAPNDTPENKARNRRVDLLVR
jgi:outer membrane protein OmpA-like peptidoglycan-associated protein